MGKFSFKTRNKVNEKDKTKYVKLNDVSAYSHALFNLPNIALVSRQTLPFAQCDGSFCGPCRKTLLEFLTVHHVHRLILKCQGLEQGHCSQMARGWQAPVRRAASSRPVSSVWAPTVPHLQSRNPKNSEKGKVFLKIFYLGKGFMKQIWWCNQIWMDMFLFIVFVPFHVNIHSICCRSVDVFDCRVLTPAPLGVLDNIWHSILNMFYFLNSSKFCNLQHLWHYVFSKGIMTC